MGFEPACTFDDGFFSRARVPAELGSCLGVVVFVEDAHELKALYGDRGVSAQ